MTGTAGFRSERGDLHRHASGMLRPGEEGASDMTLGMASHPVAAPAAVAWPRSILRSEPQPKLRRAMWYRGCRR